MYTSGKEDLKNNTSLSSVPLTALEERIAADKPELLESLTKLKSLLDEKTYRRCFEKVENMTRNATTLLIVARNPLQRSFIERDCIGALKEAFSVQYVKIIG